MDYKNWQIVLEPNFPSHNYVLTQKNVSHGFRPAYCGSLDSALNMLFEQLLIANIEGDAGYDKKLDDLYDIIIRTKDELSELIQFDVKGMTCEGGDKPS